MSSPLLRLRPVYLLGVVAFAGFAGCFNKPNEFKCTDGTHCPSGYSCVGATSTAPGLCQMVAPGDGGGTAASDTGPGLDTVPGIDSPGGPDRASSVDSAAPLVDGPAQVADTAAAVELGSVVDVGALPDAVPDNPALPDLALDRAPDLAGDFPIITPDAPRDVVPDTAPDLPRDLPPDVFIPKARGATCSLASECADGFCVDGVCCSQACAGQCQYCKVASNPGTCQTLTGAPQKNPSACTGTNTQCAGTCNGTSTSCTYPDATTTCEAAVCTATTTLSEASVCNSQGDCVAPTPQTVSCGDYACAAGACNTNCNAHSDCAAGRYCNPDTKLCGGLFYASIHSKDSHTCAVVADGTVRCWGLNDNGQLGDGTLASRSQPVSVASLANVQAISTGTAFTCALRGDQTVACWGDNGDNQLGNTSTSGGISPPSQVSNLSNVIQISTGVAHTCGVVQGGIDNRVYCWGMAQDWELGRDYEPGKPGSRASALEVPGPTYASFTSSGVRSTCAVMTGGTVSCWGFNYSGELGSACGGECEATPISGLANVRKMTFGAEFSCAQTADGTVQCWGLFPDGTSMATPTTRSDLFGATAFSAGITSWFDVQNDSTLITMCATLASGTTKCSYGTTSLLQTTTGLPSVKALTVGRSHACALLGGGTIRCWGKNNLGQLGNGTYVDSANPVDVAAPR